MKYSIEDFEKGCGCVLDETDTDDDTTDDDTTNSNKTAKATQKTESFTYKQLTGLSDKDIGNDTELKQLVEYAKKQPSTATEDDILTMFVVSELSVTGDENIATKKKQLKTKVDSIYATKQRTIVIIIVVLAVALVLFLAIFIGCYVWKKSKTVAKGYDEEQLLNAFGRVESSNDNTSDYNDKVYGGHDMYYDKPYRSSVAASSPSPFVTGDDYSSRYNSSERSHNDYNTSTAPETKREFRAVDSWWHDL